MAKKPETVDDEFLRLMLSRQQPILGDEGCKALRESVVAIAGLGGVGALAFELLARAGVGQFRLLDRDVYDTSNLNRQVFATTETIGLPKVDVAAERIKLINPKAIIQKKIFESINLLNLEELLDGADIGVVCTDSPASQILFKQVARKKKLRLIYGWTANLSCGAWVEAYDRAPKRFQLLRSPAVQRFRRALTGQRDLHDMSEQEALALDVAHGKRDRFTPTISFAANSAACLTACLTMKYLTNSDSRPHSVTMHFSDFQIKRQTNPLLTMIMRLFRMRSD